MATYKIGSVLDRWDITHQAGNRFYVLVPVLDAETAPVALADLTRVRVHVRPFVDSPDVLHVFDSEADPANAGLFDDGGAQAWFYASPAETSDWQITWPGKNGQSVTWWDIEVVDTTGEPHQLVTPGTITLTHEVTR